MTLQELNALNKADLINELTKCCGSSSWVNGMTEMFPFKNEIELLRIAEEIWFQCNEDDWLEAFEHHPKIGDINSLKEKFASTAKWAAGEQAGVNQTNEETLRKLSEGNKLYEDKFGFIFIVFASGKSAEEMLELLESRINNSRDEELKNAMMEQNKITQLRLQKLLS